MTLACAVLDLTQDPPRPLVDAGADQALPAAMLVRIGEREKEMWALIAGPETAARVNANLAVAGIAVLSDRDEIQVGGRPAIYFSTERLARVEEFREEGNVCCGRCRQPIRKGDPAVRCPGCGIWYNQSAQFPCWTYAERCAFCSQFTALDAGFNWSPED
jgi:hypothetical protein